MPDLAGDQSTNRQQAMLAIDNAKHVIGIITACRLYLTQSEVFRINDSNRTQCYALAEAFHDLWRAYEALETLPPAPQIPTHLLDTPANRKLVTLLENAAIFAEKVNAAHGRTGKSLYPNSNDATDFIEYFKDIKALVHAEVREENGNN